jgi:uncharacterized protein YegP (UPF0339 family)
MDDTWQFYKDKAGEWRWRRMSSNGRIVGASTEGYKDGKECKANAIRNGYQMKQAPYPIDHNPNFNPQGDKESLVVRILRSLIAKFSKR